MRAPLVVLGTFLVVVGAACDSPPGPGPLTAEESPPPRVPDVVGFYKTSARSALLEAGFVPVVKRKWTVDAPRDREVIRQRPVGGTELEVGAPVVIVVARPLLEVPDVFGLRLERARRVLRHVGFRVSVVKGSGGFLGSIVDRRRDRA